MLNVVWIKLILGEICGKSMEDLTYYRTASKDEVIVKMAELYANLLTAYLKKEPIYAHIWAVKSMMDILLERCK